VTKVEELRNVIVHEWWYEQKVMDEVEALVAAVREEERERIRKAGIETNMLSDRYQQQRVIVIPVSVFNSKEREP
jgi:hypothetical protein